MDLIERVRRDFRAVAPTADFCSLRVVRERSRTLAVRQDVVQPVTGRDDLGAMVTVGHRGGTGYAATPDLTRAGLAAAVREAEGWARLAAEEAPPAPDPPPVRSGTYASPVTHPWSEVPLADRIDLLVRECARLAVDRRIVDWGASLEHTETESLLVTGDGAQVRQTVTRLVPDLFATANAGSETQRRTFGGTACAGQGGLEVLDRFGFHQAAPRIADEALALLDAPECPADTTDVLLAPDQMLLQIHESIGHPLELDRILGDERNYAGTSFVTLDMLGRYRYGSELLNVTFDPSRPTQLASYGFDDEGTPAERTHVIERGILLRPLGGAGSSARAGNRVALGGIASTRASSWNRPPIDRMANLNLEPGEQSFASLVASIENGIYMETNRSWSIDDSRNKFQFGCEYGRRIVDGELREVVRNPNYRGVSAVFWRSLAGVGDAATVRYHGSPFCGKGEPNQLIAVGHASPPCRFTGVDVFGGA